jgi:hypothetical protein
LDERFFSMKLSTCGLAFLNRNTPDKKNVIAARTVLKRSVLFSFIKKTPLWVKNVPDFFRLYNTKIPKLLQIKKSFIFFHFFIPSSFGSKCMVLLMAVSISFGNRHCAVRDINVPLYPVRLVAADALPFFYHFISIVDKQLPSITNDLSAMRTNGIVGVPVVPCLLVYPAHSSTLPLALAMAAIAF